MQEKIWVNDLVGIAGEPGIWTVVATRAAERKFQVQFRNDGSTARWVGSAAVTLMQKAPKQDNNSGFAIFSVGD